MIEIREIEDKKVWEDFLLGQEWTPFLQSWNSGVHFASLGDKIWRLGIFDGRDLAGICFVSRVEAKRGWYLYCPYGPVLRSWKSDLFGPLALFLEDLGKREGCVFIKMSPYVEDSPENRGVLEKSAYRRAPLHVLSESSWILDLGVARNGSGDGRLAPTESDGLLRDMRKTHRNLIRRAEKEGVVITQSRDPKDLDIFWRLYEETGKRHRFVLYPKKFVYNQFEAYVKEAQSEIFLASVGGTVLSAAMVMYYGNEGAYHHGASLPSKIPCSYLLQWHAIQEAQRRGKKYYNFWGIYPGNNTKHPFWGITQFKKGFGGHLRQLLPCHDRPLSWKYAFNWTVERFRRWRRGFSE
ncbi:MAG: hypothetical protein G01um101418_89 [Parcubacteria group bacterium Gr01-1014_18]|nr:MAG: hypothetical protein Greene041636_393 [Parcubacteria group bacterium Greene0416_36]TSC81416.1 MAG: hypothetical protein G01um101418_89 [Parcubacteria group bacterium Gr01-1014_18]TSC99014.1 MAG: hypothetical protein Greene101420_370 [Parcubacteria group bacterium Greene1014_20]TSD07305.1 MAG: hypothetical protein Greene07142_321 [Parcubacteria group bacterium Greene0714_2]